MGNKISRQKDLTDNSTTGSRNSSLNIHPLKHDPDYINEASNVTGSGGTREKRKKSNHYKQGEEEEEEEGEEGEELDDLYCVDNLRLSEWTFDNKTGADHLTCILCFEVKEINQFKVPKCGHYVCFDCFADYLECSHDQCQRVCVYCQAPLKNKVNEKFSYKDLQTLPNPYDFLSNGGKLINLEPEDIPPNDLHQLVREHFRYRIKTIKSLRSAADILQKVTKNVAIANVSGASVSLIGTIMFITGGLISLSGVGSIVGVPLAISGAAIGGAGSLTVVGSELTKYLKKNRRLKIVNEHLRKDYFKATRVRVRHLQLQKYDYSQSLSPRDKLKYKVYGGTNAIRVCALAGSSAAMVSTTGKVAVAARSVAFSSSVFAGVTFSVITIPLDLFVMVESSIQIHKKTIPQICIQIREIATMLEKDLFSVRNTLMKEIIRFKNENLNNGDYNDIYDNDVSKSKKIGESKSVDIDLNTLHEINRGYNKHENHDKKIDIYNDDEETKINGNEVIKTMNEGKKILTRVNETMNPDQIQNAGENKDLDQSLVMINVDNNKNIHTTEMFEKSNYIPPKVETEVKVEETFSKMPSFQSNIHPALNDIYGIENSTQESINEEEDPELIALREPMIPEGYDPTVWATLPMDIRQEVATEALLKLLQEL